MLVVIASYGTGNDAYLAQLIDEYRSMRFAVDIVVLSNLDKPVPPGVELRIGLPARNPWSLPFAHKEVFASRIDDYDLFIYTEDDMLVTERNLRAFLDVAQELKDDEVAGFFRTELGPDGTINYPDLHGPFRWDARSARRRGDYVLAFHGNEHAAFYVLTRDQLRRAIASGGFLVKPHEWQYDLLCTAATDPYTQCGFTKLIPISHIDDFSIKHLSNKYVSKMGVGPDELGIQIDVLTGAATAPAGPAPAFKTETELRLRAYSKDLYESAPEDILALVRQTKGPILSVGCGTGDLESRLASDGRQVLAVPVDPVMAATAAAKGIEVLADDPAAARRALDGQTFGCLLYHNILHLMADPAATLSLFADLLTPDGRVIISLPNMLYAKELGQNLQMLMRSGGAWSYERTGSQFSSAAEARRWCRKAGLQVDRVIQHIPERAKRSAPVVAELVPTLFARDFIIVAKRAT